MLSMTLDHSTNDEAIGGGGVTGQAPRPDRRSGLAISEHHWSVRGNVMLEEKPEQYFTVTLRIAGEMAWYRFAAGDRDAALAFVADSNIFKACQIIRVHSLGCIRPKVVNQFQRLRPGP